MIDNDYEKVIFDTFDRVEDKEMLRDDKIPLSFSIFWAVICLS